MRLVPAIAVLALLAGGCLSLGPDEVVELVDYEIVVPPPAPAERPLPMTLAVRPFSASEDLDREGIRYRTSDVEGGFWADHRWAEPVPGMVREATIGYLEAAALFRRINLLDNLALADVLLVANVRRFDEEDRPEGWFGVVEITFEAMRGGEVVYHRRICAEEPCGERRVAEVVRALGRALGRVLDVLAEDFRTGRMGGGS